MHVTDWIPLLKGILDLVVSLLPLITFYVRKKVKERLDSGNDVTVPATFPAAKIPDGVESRIDNGTQSSVTDNTTIGKTAALADTATPIGESVSKNFYLSELTHSNTAHRRKIKNVPGDAEIESLKALAENVLEPLRARYPSLRISSAYRSPAVNSHVGGKEHSQHMRGEAADLHFPGQSLSEIYNWIENESGLEYDQLILEPHWIHISFKAQEENRNWAFKLLHPSRGSRSAIRRRRR